MSPPSPPRSAPASARAPTLHNPVCHLCLLPNLSPKRNTPPKCLSTQARRRTNHPDGLSRSSPAMGRWAAEGLLPTRGPPPTRQARNRFAFPTLRGYHTRPIPAEPAFCAADANTLKCHQSIPPDRRSSLSRPPPAGTFRFCRAGDRCRSKPGGVVRGTCLFGVERDKHVHVQSLRLRFGEGMVSCCTAFAAGLLAPVFTLTPDAHAWLGGFGPPTDTTVPQHGPELQRR